LTVYPDAGHDSWTETYDNQELYDWFLEHRKKSETE
jgi:predicted peptidase